MLPGDTAVYLREDGRLTYSRRGAHMVRQERTAKLRQRKTEKIAHPSQSPRPDCFPKTWNTSLIFYRAVRAHKVGGLRIYGSLFRIMPIQSEPLSYGTRFALLPRRTRA
jgi:hypothetical protein